MRSPSTNGCYQPASDKVAEKVDSEAGVPAESGWKICSAELIGTVELQDTRRPGSPMVYKVRSEPY